MDEEALVWIPSGRLYSAPHIAADGDGRPILAWLIRENFENSNSCIIVADPKKLLTDTRPEGAGCSKVANLRIGLGMVDLLSSSPQLSMVLSAPSPDPRALPSIVATGLTGQRRSKDLAICVSADMRMGQKGQERGELIGKLDVLRENTSQNKWQP